MRHQMSDSKNSSKWIATSLALALFIVALTILGWRLWNRQIEIEERNRLEGPPPVEIPEDKIKTPVAQPMKVR